MTGAGIAEPGLSVAWISRNGGLGSPRSLEIILKGAPAA
jgi:hypothetical protein